ncbi:single-stranded-DNA-specific exonuclease RecJ [Candidatus Tokpelaia sp.]|nr:single-stranded-DNA-specific exonuclease RecJ [Candidatus Tokpelaia sp.]
MGQSGFDYLGIARSAGGKSWRQQLNEHGENAALHIEQKYNVPAALALVLAARGIEAGNVPAFLNPSLRALMPEPYKLQDMEKAAKRLCRACLSHEKIAVFADYDVDGACSAALLLRFLAAVGVDCRLYVPDRLTEGYGPNEKALRLLAAEGVSLIITVDCGANSSAVFKAAQLAEVDILVLDHHRPAQPQNGLNKAGGERAGQQIIADFIHVNPNRPDDESGLGTLCAAGVVFMCLTATARLLRAQNIQTIPDLLGLLDLVALATICDIVPLYGLNRAFVTKGLLIARQQRNIGLQALAQAARIKAPLNSYHFGYILGPRINAGGRVGDAALGARLLSCDKAEEADHIAAQLDSLNYGRQALEAEQLRQAMEQIETAAASEQSEAAKMVFACGNWHIGIIGLLAARLKERFGLPAFIMTKQATGRVTGSARASGAFDLGALIAQAVAANMLEKGGGHRQAAGFSLAADRLEDFRRFLAANLAAVNSAQETSAHEEAHILKLDGSLSAGGATVELIEELAKAGPYGAGWPQPLFAFPNHNLAYVQAVGKDGAHLRVILADGHGGRLNAVAFRAGQTELGQFLLSHAGQQAHIAGTLSLNYWNGQTTPQLHIIDAAAAE